MSWLSKQTSRHYHSFFTRERILKQFLLTGSSELAFHFNNKILKEWFKIPVMLPVMPPAYKWNYLMCLQLLWWEQGSHRPMDIKKVYYQEAPRKVKHVLKQSLFYSVKLYFMGTDVQIPLVALFPTNWLLFQSSSQPHAPRI